MAMVPSSSLTQEGTGGTLLNNAVWANWNCQITTTATTMNIPASITWANWCSAGTTSTQWLVLPTTWTAWNVTYTETREQREARERAQAQAALRAEEARKARLVAKERALELLGYVLSPEQMASYRERGWFEVISSKRRRWRIRDRGQSGNVDLMPEIGDERLASYCAHPPGGLPDPDAHLAQALQLVTDEDAFLRVANCHYRRQAA